MGVKVFRIFFMLLSMIFFFKMSLNYFSASASPYNGCTNVNSHVPKEVMVERYVDKHFQSSLTSLERKQAFKKRTHLDTLSITGSKKSLTFDHF